MASSAVEPALAPVVDAAGFGGFEALEDRLAELAGGQARVLVIASPEQWLAPLDSSQLRRFELYPLPTIAAFEGELTGYGLDLALACDIRVCGAGATMRTRSVGSRRLLTLLGHIASVDLFARRGASDAGGMLDFGLVSEVVTAGGALGAAREAANTIAGRGPIATRLAKEAIWRGLEMPLRQGLRYETDLTLLLQTTKDRAEGVRAFLEKRPPTFTGE